MSFIIYSVLYMIVGFIVAVACVKKMGLSPEDSVPMLVMILWPFLLVLLLVRIFNWLVCKVADSL